MPNQYTANRGKGRAKAKTKTKRAAASKSKAGNRKTAKLKRNTKR